MIGLCVAHNEKCVDMCCVQMKNSMFHFTVSGIIMPRQGCNEKKIYKDKHIFLDETVNKTSRTSIRPNDGPPPLLHGLIRGCRRSLVNGHGIPVALHVQDMWCDAISSHVVHPTSRVTNKTNTTKHTSTFLKRIPCPYFPPALHQHLQHRPIPLIARIP